MPQDIFKVFLLEDSPEDMLLNKRQVRKYNPNVLFSTATNRADFEPKILEFEPDIVLSDYNLPDMNGLDALLYVREHLDGTPFILVTGILNDEERAAEAILEGASGYLLKHNIKQLPELLHKVVEENRAVIEQREREWEKRKNVRVRLQKLIAQLQAQPSAGSDIVAAELKLVLADLE